MSLKDTALVVDYIVWLIRPTVGPSDKSRRAA
jgi:hypothetical protein